MTIKYNYSYFTNTSVIDAAICSFTKGDTYNWDYIFVEDHTRLRAELGLK